MFFARFLYFRPQIKFCGWVYKMAHSIKLYTEFKNGRQKKEIYRSAIHLISPGIELTTSGFLLNNNPKVVSLIPGLIK